MDLYSNKLLPHVIEFENMIEANSEQMGLNDWYALRQRLLSLMSRLKGLENSNVAINRVPPGLLYEIFKLAVYDSPRPEATALKVSGVCRHWRKSALGWPALWAFVSSHSPRWIVRLFMSRSGDAPLTVSCVSLHVPLDLESHPSKSYTESPFFLRVSSLRICLPSYDLASLERLSWTYKIPPLRLRSLNVTMENHSRGEPETIEFIPMDVSFLQEMKLERINLPYPGVLREKLTHLVLIYYDQRPALSRLLVFLSNCPVLHELQLDVKDLPMIGATSPTRTNLSTANLPRLKRLAFTATGEVGYDYIRTCSEFIRFSERLSQFHLRYLVLLGHVSIEEKLMPCTILKSVPSEIRHCLDNYPYLMLDFGEVYFTIASALTRSSSSNDYALYLSCPIQNHPPLDRSDLLEFIHTMSKTTHLELSPGTLHKFELFKIDIRTEFPCLDILTISGHLTTKALNLVPVDLKLKELQLDQKHSTSCHSDIIMDLDAILTLDIKKLVLLNWFSKSRTPANHVEVIDVLLKRGIQVSIDPNDRT